MPFNSSSEQQKVTEARNKLTEMFKHNTAKDTLLLKTDIRGSVSQWFSYIQFFPLIIFTNLSRQFHNEPKTFLHFS